MQFEASMSVCALGGFLELAAMHGLKKQDVLTAAGCVHALDDVDGRVPWQVAERIGAVIIDRMGIAGLLRATSVIRGDRFGPLYYVVRHSPTLRVGLTRMARYYRVSSTLAEPRFIETSSMGRMELWQRNFLSVPFKEANSGVWAVAVVAVIRQLTGGDFHPLSVSLEVPEPRASAELQAYRTALPYQLRFGAPFTSVEFDAAHLERELAAADPVLEAALMRYIAELAARIPDEATLGRRLSKILVESIYRGTHSVDGVARQLGTTARTMQRRLREEGTSYSRLLDEVRQQIAVTHIRDRNASADEIASMLGFDKSSSFHRAFKRWTGFTPGQFRRQSGGMHGLETSNEQ